MIEVSIIVPVYNVEKYIEKCIQSILGQTFKNFELIVIDDGSEDSSWEICNKYQNLDNRITVYHRDNCGLSEARNFGIAVSQGKYICFVDSDDYLRNDSIEKLYEAIVKYKVKLVICGCQRVNEQGRPLYTETIIDGGIYEANDLFKYIIKSNGWYYVTAWNRIYDRELFDKIRFPKGKISEDMFIVCSLFETAKQIAVITDRLYYYVQRNGSIMHSKPDIKQLDRVEAYYFIYVYFEEHGYKKLLDETFLQLEKIYFMLRGKMHNISSKEKDRCIKIDMMYQELYQRRRGHKCKYPIARSRVFILRDYIVKVIKKFESIKKVE